MCLALQGMRRKDGNLSEQKVGFHDEGGRGRMQKKRMGFLARPDSFLRADCDIDVGSELGKNSAGVLPGIVQLSFPQLYFYE